RILKVTPAGNISTLFSGPPLQNPIAIAVDFAGNIIVGDNASDSLFRITPGGTSITEFFRLTNPSPSLLQDIKITLDNSGSIIVATDDSGAAFDRSIILKITSNGAVSTIFDGTAIQSIGGLDIDSSGNFIVADFRQQAIFKVTPLGNVTTVSSEVGINLTGLTVDSAGNYVVTANFDRNVLRITPAGTVTTLFSGTPLAFPTAVTTLPSINLR